MKTLIIQLLMSSLVLSSAWSEESITVTTFFPPPKTNTIKADIKGQTTFATDEEANSGIGTNSPITKLHIKGSKPQGAQITLESDNNKPVSLNLITKGGPTLPDLSDNGRVNLQDNHVNAWQLEATGNNQEIISNENNLLKLHFFNGDKDTFTPNFVLSPDGKASLNNVTLLGALTVKGAQTIPGDHNNWRGIVVSNHFNNNKPKGAISILGARYNMDTNPFNVLSNWDTGEARIVYIGGGDWKVPDATNIRFYTEDNYSEETSRGEATERMRITPLGSIGIGTHAPSDQYMLNISSNNSINNGLISEAKNIGGTFKGDVGLETTGAKHGLYSKIESGNHTYLNKNNFGVLTNGDIEGKKFYGTEYAYTSSINSKKDIQILDAAMQNTILQELIQTPVVLFNFKDNPEASRKNIGIIAEWSPEAIKTQSGDQIEISQYLSYSLAAIKSLAQKIEDQEKEITQLKNELNKAKLN